MLHHTDLELLTRLLVDVRPNHEGWEEQQAFAKGSCSRLFRVFAGREVVYFEHYNGGNPVSQLQSSDFTKVLFFFSFYLKVNIGWTPRWKTLGCPTISSALDCGYQLSSDQEQAGTSSGLTTFDLDWFF